MPPPPVVIRVLQFREASGPEQMAADETMLLAAEQGSACLRFYAWSEPTVSLGYFQRAADRASVPGLERLAWVRRSTGGGALVHHHEITYALALPAGPTWDSGARPWTCRLHDIIQTSLRKLGIESEVLTCGQPQSEREFLCFKHHTTGDLVIQGHKIAGSAQRRQHGAIMQHGGILLKQSEHAPMLPGIAELTGKEVTPLQLFPLIMMELAMQTGWKISRSDWTEAEQTVYAEALAKYRSAEWNEKR